MKNADAFSIETVTVRCKVLSGPLMVSKQREKMPGNTEAVEAEVTCVTLSCGVPPCGARGRRMPGVWDTPETSLTQLEANTFNTAQFLLPRDVFPQICWRKIAGQGGQGEGCVPLFGVVKA